MTAREKGDLGERLVAEAYQKVGYSLLAQNYRTRLGEVDLILGKDDLIVFCEVKTRGSRAIAKPAEWVGAAKQQKVMAAAQQYLQAKRLNEPMMRFDVVEVVTDAADGRDAVINIIENAFTA